MNKDILERRHPLYAKFQKYWQYYADAFEGGPEYPGKPNPIAVQVNSLLPGDNLSARYLWQHAAETDRDYSARLNRAIVVNVCAPVVNFFSGMIGAQENVSLDLGGDETLEVIRDNFDGQGKSYQQFMGSPRKTAMVLGHTFLVVDAPTVDEPILTKADEKRLGVRPYVYEVKPADVLNWRLDTTGNFEEILFKLPDIETRSIVDSEASSDPGCVYVLWTKTMWQRYRLVKDQVQLIAEGPNALGQVPVVVQYFRRCGQLRSESLLKDAAKTMQAVVNGFSSLDESFGKQMFAIPVLTSESSPKDVGAGVSTMLHLRPASGLNGGGESFGYVAPPVAPFVAGIDWVYRLIALANKQMGIAPTAITDGNVDNKSGTSKAWDNHEAAKLMGEAALEEQETGKRLWELIQLYLGTAVSVQLEMITQYDLETLQDGITRVIQSQAAGLPPLAVARLKSKAIAKMLPSLSDDDKAQIEAELNGTAEETAVDTPPVAQGA